jgi:hypothetical protein
VRSALAALLLVALAAAGCGGSKKDAPTLAAASPPLAKRLLERQLDAMQLDYTGIACVKVGRTYRHVPITRCNVNFGIDPHVEAYCVLLKDGKLATNHTDRAIPCRHDDAGWDRTTITS